MTDKLKLTPTFNDRAKEMHVVAAHEPLKEGDFKVLDAAAVQQKVDDFVRSASATIEQKVNRLRGRLTFSDSLYRNFAFEGGL